MDGLFIGRFQPFHLGHVHAITHALSQVDNLWVGIGSSNRPLEKQNPFSASERRQMILSSLNESVLNRVKIFDIPDLDNHQEWAKNIRQIVPKFDIIFTNDSMTRHVYSRAGITVSSIPFENRDFFCGTVIRQRILQGQDWEKYVPAGTRDVLLDRLI